MKIFMHLWQAYSYRDIIAALERMGHEVHTERRQLDHYDEDQEFEAYFEECLWGEEYDLVFTVNYFSVIAQVCHRLQIPYASWTCDSPLISMYHESVFYDTNYIFTFDKSNYHEFRQMGVEHIYYLPLTTCVKRIDLLIEDRKKMQEKEEREIVSFVGSLYEKNSYDEIYTRLTPYLQGYLEAVMEAQLNVSGGNLVSRLLTSDILCELEQIYHLEKAEGSFSDLELIFSTTVLGFKIAQIQRKRTLLELSVRYPVTLYSNSDASDLLRVEKKQSVDYWSEMPWVFYNSKINLNLTIPNIQTGIPLRVWDVLGSGGFLITDFQAELPLYFENGKDLVWFEDPEELPALIGYYLEHEEERAAIARHGRETVRNSHCYERRLEKILHTIFECEME